jgi:hypothetical protein
MNKHECLATGALSSLCVGPFANDQNYSQFNFVTSGVAQVSVLHLVNPWVIACSSGSPWWNSDSGTGPSALYRGTGAITRTALPVRIVTGN